MSRDYHKYLLCSSWFLAASCSLRFVIATSRAARSLPEDSDERCSSPCSCSLSLLEVLSLHHAIKGSFYARQRSFNFPFHGFGICIRANKSSELRIVDLKTVRKRRKRTFDWKPAQSKQHTLSLLRWSWCEELPV